MKLNKSLIFLLVFGLFVQFSCVHTESKNPKSTGNKIWLKRALIYTNK